MALNPLQCVRVMNSGRSTLPQKQTYLSVPRPWFCQIPQRIEFLLASRKGHLFQVRSTSSLEAVQNEAGCSLDQAAGMQSETAASDTDDFSSALEELLKRRTVK
jgi:hypothetical protein